jgi:hypothetical protein
MLRPTIGTAIPAGPVALSARWTRRPPRPPPLNVGALRTGLLEPHRTLLASTSKSCKTAGMAPHGTRSRRTCTGHVRRTGGATTARWLQRLGRARRRASDLPRPTNRRERTCAHKSRRNLGCTAGSKTECGCATPGRSARSQSWRETESVSTARSASQCHDNCYTLTYLIRRNKKAVVPCEVGQYEELVVSLHSPAEEGFVVELRPGDLPQERCLAHRRRQQVVAMESLATLLGR